MVRLPGTVPDRAAGPVIAVDLDGTVADWVEGMRRWLATHLDPRAAGLPEPARYRLETDPHWGRLVGPGRFGRLLRLFATDGGYGRLAPYPGAVEALGRLVDGGVRVLVVTSRLADPPVPRVVGDTRAWLVRHRIPHHGLILLRGAKSPVVGGGVRWLVDDDPDQLDRARRDGLEALRCPRPWNRTSPHRPLDWDAVRARGVDSLD